jgi:hypothetical protein
MIQTPYAFSEDFNILWWECLQLAMLRCHWISDKFEQNIEELKLLVDWLIYEKNIQEQYDYFYNSGKRIKICIISRNQFMKIHILYASIQLKNCATQCS